MIIKSSQRSAHRELAAHLMKQRDIDGTPQTVTVSGSRDLLMGHDVYASLDDMALLSQASDRCQKHLYHVSMSPDQAMQEDAWEAAWSAYEQEYGLSHLPYIEVTHAKGNRPPHRHRVYERVDTEIGKAVHLSYTHVRNEKVARIIEYVLGHQFTLGKHNRAVIKRLVADGDKEIIAWMEQQQAHQRSRPIGKKNHTDTQQEKRTQVAVEQVKADLMTCYQNTATGKDFEAAIAEKGYVLARGDRRDFVVVDWQGGVHSPRRRLGVKAKDLRDKWQDLPLEDLPTVAEVHSILGALQDANTDDASATSFSTSSDTSSGRAISPEEKLAQLQQEAEYLEAEIRVLEEQLEQDAQQDKQDKLREELNYWQRRAEAESEPERSKPQSASPTINELKEELKTWGLDEQTQQQLQLQGRQAVAERQRRLGLLIPSKKGRGKLPKYPPNPEKEMITAYQAAWQECFGASSNAVANRATYRLADRWILARLAQRGYSRVQARRVLAQASPELLNQRPAERLRYIRRMVHHVYGQQEQQQQLDAMKRKQAERGQIKERGGRSGQVSLSSAANTAKKAEPDVKRKEQQDLQRRKTAAEQAKQRDQEHGR